MPQPQPNVGAPSGAETRRRQLLAKVHVAQKQLALKEEEYRAILWERFRKESAGGLVNPELVVLVEHLKALGWRDAPVKGAGRRPNTANAGDKGALTRKIIAYLAEAGRPTGYADGIAKRMYQVEKLEWCSVEQLRGIVAALEKDARRHGRWTPDNPGGVRRGG